MELLSDHVKDDDRKIWELEYKLKEVERKFKADKALIESEPYNT